MSHDGSGFGHRFQARVPADTHSSFIVILGRRFEAQQCRAKLVGCRGQQLFGLDAGLDRGIEPDEVEGHVADQREVVGDVAGAGVIITELNIETPVQTIHDRPVTSDFLRDPLGVGGRAADVADALGSGAIAHRSDAFAQGEASYVPPGDGVAKPIDGIVGAAATHFDSAVCH